MVGSWMLWREASIGVEMHFSVFQTLYIPKVTAGDDKTKGWYYLISWGFHIPFVLDLSSSIKKLEGLVVLDFWKMGHNGGGPLGAPYGPYKVFNTY